MSDKSGFLNHSVDPSILQRVKDQEQEEDATSQELLSNQRRERRRKTLKKNSSTAQNLLKHRPMSPLCQSEIKEEEEELSDKFSSFRNQTFVPESLSEQSRKLRKNNKPISAEDNNLSGIEESLPSSQATKKQLTDKMSSVSPRIILPE